MPKPRARLVLAAFAAVLALLPAAASAARPVYVSQYDGGIDLFGTAPVGVLRPRRTNWPVPAPRRSAITPDGKYLYVGENINGVRGYSIGAGGVLTAPPGNPSPPATSVYAITVTADGKHLYVPNQSSSGNIFGFNIAANGS